MSERDHEKLDVAYSVMCWAYLEKIAWALGTGFAAGCAFLATGSLHAMWCFLPGILVHNYNPKFTVKTTGEGGE